MQKKNGGLVAFILIVGFVMWPTDSEWVETKVRTAAEEKVDELLQNRVDYDIEKSTIASGRVTVEGGRYLVGISEVIVSFSDSKSCKYYYGVEFEDGIQLGSFDCDKKILENWKRVNEFSEETSWKYNLHRFIQKIDPFN